MAAIRLNGLAADKPSPSALIVALLNVVFSRMGICQPFCFVYVAMNRLICLSSDHLVFTALLKRGKSLSCFQESIFLFFACKV